jgi:dTDP-4-amino-4,6-dideoxygalactose transaminase
MVNRNGVLEKYAGRISDCLGNAPQVFLFWKGRVALYAILKAMGVGPGDEVILPAYTCVVVPNAILYTGAKPVYAEVRQDTYCLDPEQLEKAITRRTRVIICQNTYGLSAGVGTVTEIARAKGIYTIEDCAHGFGGMYDGKNNGAWCDASFFSSQWNKPFSTGLGGFAVVNTPELVPQLREVDSRKQAPHPGEAMLLRLLISIRRRVVTDFSYWPILKLYRFMSRHNLIIGSSQGGEISSQEMPPNYLKGLSAVQAGEGLRALDRLEESIALRRRNAEIFTNFLAEKEKNRVHRDLFPNHAFLRYPLLVTNRPAFLAAGERARIPLGDWFNSPLHPIQDRFHQWGLRPEDYPTALNLANRVINLPTDTRDSGRVLSFLSDHIDFIGNER